MKTRIASNLWPLGIITAFVLFIAGTACLIVLACSNKSELVSADYYQRELKFQDQIDRVQRAQHLSAKAKIDYDAVGGKIKILIPQAELPSPVTGRISLYRPSASGLDRDFELKVTPQGTQTIDVCGLASGLWRVRLSWAAGDQDFFFEQPIIIGGAPQNTGGRT